MKLELLILGITGFLVFNTYHDGKYTQMLKVGQKYAKMVMFGFAGLSLYLFLKKHPTESKSMIKHVSQMVKFLPIDKNTKDIVTPFFDFQQPSFSQTQELRQTPQMKRMMNSGLKANKRSVSEAKKKYVASNQKWRCGKCNEMLSGAYEVHHITPLKFGGSNHISNLEALCRNCHGIETMKDNM